MNGSFINSVYVPPWVNRVLQRSDHQGQAVWTGLSPASAEICALLS